MRIVRVYVNMDVKFVVTKVMSVLSLSRVGTGVAPPQDIGLACMQELRSSYFEATGTTLRSPLMRMGSPLSLIDLSRVCTLYFDLA